ncbi:MAG TPA: hypothetical protein VKY19_25955 [Ktedonosporobacter sp.]|jgi:hypothetical protein|nr:hypothetical protein [Ktedonosporobacter sp.]
MNDSPEQIPFGVSQPDTRLLDSSQQPGPQQKARKSRRTWWIIAAVVLLLVLIAGGLGFFVGLPTIQKSSLERTLQTYCHAYKSLDDKELESTFSARFKALPVKENRSEGDYLYEYLQIKGFGASFAGCTVSDIQQNGSTATATITLSLQGGATQQGFSEPTLSSTSTQNVSLILENGLWNWKVNDVQEG